MVAKTSNVSFIHQDLNGREPNETSGENFSFTNFSKEFDEHIDKSIRGYFTLRSDVVKITEYFVEDDMTVLHLGCSQGSLLRMIKRVLKHCNDRRNCGNINAFTSNDNWR